MKQESRYWKWLRSWQTKPENGLASTANQQENASASEQARPLDIQISTSGQPLTIDTLIYWDFIQMMLGRIEQPTNWDEIKAEFSEAIKTPKSTTIFECWKKIESLTNRMELVSVSCNFLKNIYDADIAAILQLNGYDYVQDLPERDAYLKQIYLIETEAKTMVVMLNQYYNEYRLLCPEGVMPSEPTVADYDKELAILSKFVGHRINKFEITTSEFCAYANLYIESNG